MTNEKLRAQRDALRSALQAVIAWAIENEEGSAYVASMRKPVTFAKARDALALSAE